MTHRDKTVLRTALRIHDRLTESEPEPLSVAMLHATANLCLNLGRRIQKAEARGWNAAPQCLRCELETSLDQLRDCVVDVRRWLAPAPPSLVMPVPHIYSDLLALQQEFDDVKIDLHRLKITCRTSPVELEDVYLGPFDIVLYLDGLGSSDTYEVVAIDPFPAASNDNVTHPHVDGDRLCEGEARASIKNALWQARLFDFFLIVRQTLQTYNPESAYVELGQWNGQRCEDCDGFSEDMFTCERCAASVCGDCTSDCVGCGSIACSACKTSCAACHDPSCSKCLTPCDTCKDSICQECSNNGQCPECERKERASEVELATESAAGAAV